MQNDKVDIKEIKILSDNWYTLKKVVFDYTKKDGTVERQEREAYDRGNGATILLYNKTTKSIILTRQFRVPTYINGNPTGMLIEACAGLLDNDSPEVCIKKETEEETGYIISEVKKVFEAYMSPGSVTEIIHFFIAEYSSDTEKGKGGGLETEQEEIEVLEYNFENALEMVQNGEIKDGKTILLIQYLRIHQIL